jgi:hypothetical protein
MINIKISTHQSEYGPERIICITGEDSIAAFGELLNRALNCWDSAPKELKELGDMWTHGHITQDHTYYPINTTTNTDTHSSREIAALNIIRLRLGDDAYRELLYGDRVELNEMLKAELARS